MGISRFIIRLGLIGSGLFLATFAAVSIWTFGDFWTTEAKAPKSDVVFCLGSGMDPSTGKLDPFSRQRAKTCARLFARGKTDKIIFTGAGPRGATDVATLMAQLAQQNGVPPDAIIVEPNAQSTLQNALFSQKLSMNAHSAILVTDSFHLPRSWMSFYWLGTPDLTLIPSRSKNPADQVMPKVPMLTRETLAIWFNALRFPVYWAAKQLNVSNAVDILY